jgi:hypothetical protein
MITDNLNGSLKHFLTYWNDKRVLNLIPTRANIDPMDIRSFLSGICILDLEYAEGKFDRAKIQLAGTQFYEMVGYEITGRYLDEIMPSKIYEELKSQLCSSTESKEPCFRHFHWENGPLSQPEYQQILASLGEQGKLIEQFIGMHALISSGPYAPQSQFNTRFVA